MIDTDIKTLLDLVTYISCIVILCVYKLSTWAVIFCACTKLTLYRNLQHVVLVSLSRQQ